MAHTGSDLDIPTRQINTPAGTVAAPDPARLVTPHSYGGPDGYAYPGKIHRVSSGARTMCGAEVIWHWRYVAMGERLPYCKTCFPLEGNGMRRPLPPPPSDVRRQLTLWEERPDR